MGLDRRGWNPHDRKGPTNAAGRLISYLPPSFLARSVLQLIAETHHLGFGWPAAVGDVSSDTRDAASGGKWIVGNKRLIASAT